MSFTINIYYTGENESAKKFAKEMVEKGEIGIVGGIHEISSGKVTFFEN